MKSSSPVYFDTHAHLNTVEFVKDIREVINRAREKGVRWILDVGDSVETSKKSIELFKDYSEIYSCIGIHPHNAGKALESDFHELEKLLLKDSVVALGEVGLDYYYEFSDKDVQKEIFTKQIRLAKRLGKPVVIHCRQAENDLVSIIQKEGPVKGVAHCFSGNADFLKECLDIGLWISFSGIITFKKAMDLRETASAVPSDKLLIETDSPYLSPVPFRGRRNEPAFVTEVARCIAEIRGVSQEKIAETTTENALSFFDLKQNGHSYTMK